MQKLAAHISMPEDITSKVMVQYNGRRDSKPVMRSRVLPEETEYRSDEMRRVYQGIFVKQMVLFDGKSWSTRFLTRGVLEAALARGERLTPPPRTARGRAASQASTTWESA